MALLNVDCECKFLINVLVVFILKTPSTTNSSYEYLATFVFNSFFCMSTRKVSIPEAFCLTLVEVIVRMKKMELKTLS